MSTVFEGLNAKWLDEFITSQAAEESKKEAMVAWENDIITAVKTKRYSNLDEALSDLRLRTGITETAMTSIKNAIIKKVAVDKEWHDIHGTTTKELKKLAATKLDLVRLASDFDVAGDKNIADSIDEVLNELP